VARLAIEASLARMSPAFQPLASRPGVSTSGSTTSGTVTLDFGDAFSSGTDVDSATLRGEVDATYVLNGSAATVNVTFRSLTARTDHLGGTDVGGTLTIGLTISGSTASGTIVGSVTTSSSSDTSTVQPNLTFTVNGATFVANGTTSLASSLRGRWTSALGNETSTIDPPGARHITSGTVSLTRTSGASLGVSLIFTGADQGTATVSPGGDTRSFHL
jgi:hypothetical protein